MCTSAYSRPILYGRWAYIKNSSSAYPYISRPYDKTCVTTEDKVLSEGYKSAKEHIWHILIVNHVSM